MDRLNEHSKMSYTKIRTYLTCGLMFKYRYIDRLPVANAVRVFKEGTEFHDKVKAYILGDEEIPDIRGIQDLKSVLVNPVFEYQVEIEDFKGVLDIYQYPNIVVEIKSYCATLKKIEEQLTIYFLALYEAGVNEIEFYLVTPCHVEKKVYIEDDILKLIDKFYVKAVQVQKDIERGLFKAVPGSACFNCEYRAICEALNNRQDLKELVNIEDKKELGKSLALRLIKLEGELEELKEIAKQLIDEGVQVEVNDYAYDYHIYEELEVNAKELFDYLTSKGINPFNIVIGKKAKSVLKVDNQVFKSLLNADENLSSFVNVKLRSVFKGMKKCNQGV